MRGWWTSVPPWEGHIITYVIFWLRICSLNIIMKKLRKPKTWNVLLKKKKCGWVSRRWRDVVLKNVIIIKNKERLWKCSRLNESKGTWKLNVIPDHGMNSVLLKNCFYKVHFWTNWQKWNMDDRFDKSIVSVSIS